MIECFPETVHQDNNASSHMLSGIPFLSKDNILQKGMIASAGSKILLNHIAPYSSTIINKLL